MSVDPSLALQGAVVSALRTAGTAAGAHVYDRVDPADPYPRITIGEGQSLGDYADCMNGTETFLDVHVWSRAVGFVEAKRIADRVREVLHDADLPLEGHHLDLIEFRDARTMRDPDGITSHIAMTFRALTLPET